MDDIEKFDRLQKRVCALEAFVETLKSYKTITAVPQEEWLRLYVDYQ